ncbi:hypothetical protein EDB89DRAFT_2075526 [Lactarius sanguifluus]|nr:hypothetical protein EDB89DRAFT_2075526 [Lactarius sanguifluus]
MDELRELASIPRFPHEILQGLPQSPNVEMRDMASLLHPQRIGYGFYLQAADLTPLKEGLQIGTTSELNAAFHAIAATLSAGLDRPGEPHLRVLRSADWYRAATIVSSALLRGILTSNHFYTQGDFSLSPCPDEFQLAEGLSLPHTQRALLQEMNAQLQAELAALGDAQVTCTALRDTVWVDKKRAVEEAVRAELAPQVEEWKKGMWAGLHSLAVNEGFDYLIDQISVEGLAAEASVAGALQLEYQLYKQQWETENTERLRARHAEWDELALKEHKATYDAQAMKEWCTWRATKLAEAKKTALARVSLKDIIRECGTDADLLIQEKKQFAWEYVAHKYQDWVAEEQARIWPDVEQATQKTSLVEYFREEMDRIYPEVRADVRAQADGYCATLLASQQKKIRAEVAEENALATIKKKQGGKKAHAPSPMDTKPDGVAHEATKVLVSYEGSQMSPTPSQTAPGATTHDTPIKATTPQVGPKENGANGVASSMHCPANVMEAEPSSPTVPAPTPPTAAPAASIDPMVGIAQMLTTLTASVASLAIVPTAPSTAPPKAAPSKKVAAPTPATKPAPPKAKAGSLNTLQEGASHSTDRTMPPPATAAAPPKEVGATQTTRAEGRPMTAGTTLPTLPAKPMAPPPCQQETMATSTLGNVGVPHTPPRRHPV